MIATPYLKSNEINRTICYLYPCGLLFETYIIISNFIIIWFYSIILGRGSGEHSPGRGALLWSQDQGDDGTPVPGRLYRGRRSGKWVAAGQNPRVDGVNKNPCRGCP